MKEKCPICGKYELDLYDECPYCAWEYDGTESEWDEEEPGCGPMRISIAEGKRMVARGLNVWGYPLPKE